ncbi:MAG: ABC transporter permease [Christensenellaceae bacterium]|nr:ABC transporter permease [Christensenellaceae bacterium]
MDFYSMAIGLMQNTLRTATPVVLAALGCLLTDHVGMMNIGVDGMMLIGAFAAVMGSWLLGSWVLGIAVALGIGLVLGLLYGVFVIKLKSDEFIIGVALNVFAGGLTTFLLRAMTGQTGTFHAEGGLSVLPRFSLSFLDSIPVIGPLLNNNTLLVYISWLLVLACWLLIYRTPLGFWMRSAGEHPQSLRSAGKSPEKIKYLASLLCGMLACLAGAHLSMGYLSTFSENMSNSRGFIAVACVIFGRSNPPKVFLAALLFGFIDALGMRLQSVGISSNLTSIFPYVGTVLMMVLVVWRAERRKRRMSL